MLAITFFPQIFFKNRHVDNEGYVLFVRKNAIQILIPKYGLEATLYLDSKAVTFEYNEEVCHEGQVPEIYRVL